MPALHPLDDQSMANLYMKIIRIKARRSFPSSRFSLHRVHKGHFFMAVIAVISMFIMLKLSPFQRAFDALCLSLVICLNEISK